MEKRNNLSEDAGRDQLQDDDALLTGGTAAQEDGDENYDDEDLDDEDLDEEDDDDELLDDDDDADEEDEKDVI